jgi:hypothetical protein
MREDFMAKYQQWLHHQEVGRRLREQIATYEQERERVQRMAPSHPTTLPDINNPLIRALLDYTGRGGSLGRPLGTRISGTPGTGTDTAEAHQRQPVSATYAPAQAQPQATVGLTGAQSGQENATPPSAAPDDIIAQLAARAAQIPADPVAAMRALANNQGNEPQISSKSPEPQPAPESPPAHAPEGATPGQWWQNFRTQS